MKQLVFALAVLVCASATSFAGTVYISGDGNKDNGASGVLQILFNTSPENYSLLNGGTFFGLTVATPGVIEIESATILNPSGRWATANATGVTPNGVGAFAASSVGGGGLPLGDAVVFAEVAYKVVGAAGATTALNFTVGEEAIVHGAAGDVTSQFTFTPGTLAVTGTPIIPEPATLAMLGMGAIGLVLRRRNG